MSNDRLSRKVYKKASILEGADRAFYDALQGLASFVGLGDVVKRGVANKEYMTPAQANDLINGIVAKARNLSDDKLNQLQSKLDALPYITTPTIRNTIAKARKQISNDMSKIRSANAVMESKISSAQGLVDDIANANAADYATGKVDELKKKAIDQANRAVSIARDPNNIKLEDLSNEQKI